MKLIPILYFVVLFSLKSYGQSFDRLQRSLEKTLKEYNQTQFWRRAEFSDEYAAFIQSKCNRRDSLARQVNRGVYNALNYEYDAAASNFIITQGSEFSIEGEYNLVNVDLQSGNFNRAYQALNTLPDDMAHILYNRRLLARKLGEEINDIFAATSTDYSDNYLALMYLLDSIQDVKTYEVIGPNTAAVALYKSLYSDYSAVSSTFISKLEVFRQVRIKDEVSANNLALSALSSQEPEIRDLAKKELKKYHNHLAMYIDGLTALEYENVKRAKSFFLKSLRIKPDFYEALVQLGRMYTEMDSFALAASYFTKALAIEKSRPEAHYGLGLVEYLKTRDNLSYMVYFGLEDAEQHLKKALEFIRDQQDVAFNAHLILGYIKLKQTLQSFEADQDQLLEAVEHFNKCLEIEANNARVYVGKALAANLQSDFTDALAYLQRAKEIAPNDAHIHLVEASILYELEDFQNAYRVFKSAYAIDSTNAETINGVSISARQLVNFDEAIQFGALAMKKSERTEYYDEYENNQAINYHYKADYMMLNGSAEDSVVARDLFRDALALQAHAFEISGDSAYLMNMGAVMLDSCAGTNAFCDSLARAQFSLGGYLYGKYVSNNFGVLEAIKGNYANAEKYFDQAIVNNDLKYWHPHQNLKLLGNKRSTKIDDWLKQQLSKPINQRLGKTNGFIITILYHYNYLYRFELRESLDFEVKLRPMEPSLLPIINYILIPCENKNDFVNEKGKAKFPKQKRFEKYDGGCPEF